MWLWTYFSILQSISWLIQKIIDQEQAVFYKNEVERPTDKIEIFTWGLECLSECLGNMNQDYLKWDIYLWKSLIFYPKLLFLWENPHLKIIRWTYLSVACRTFQAFNDCWDISSSSKIALSPSSYFSRNGDPNKKPNIKDHWSMAKVETARPWPVWIGG